jgi:nucleotide-binding universal stress UspA family protein
MFQKILIPTDGSALSDVAVTAAIKFAKEINASVVAISVAEPYLYVPAIADGFVIDAGLYNLDLEKLHNDQVQQIAQDNVMKVIEAAKLAEVTCGTITAVSSNPHEEIIHAAESLGCDLIIMATHGRKGLNKLFLGSETQKVIAHSSIPVMVYR